MDNLFALLSQFSPTRFGINPLDIIIVVVVLFYAYEGYALGFLLASLDLVSFILSFIIALKFYGVVARILMDAFSMPIGFANAAGFFLLAFVSEILLSYLFRRLLHFAPVLPSSNALFRFFKKADN